MTPEERKEFDSLKQTLALFELAQMKKNEAYEKQIARSVDDNMWAILEAQVKELEKISLEPYLQGFETRIKTLEEARQRLIELNKEYSAFSNTWKEDFEKRLNQKSEGEPIVLKKKKWWW